MKLFRTQMTLMIRILADFSLAKSVSIRLIRVIRVLFLDSVKELPVLIFVG